MYDEPVRECELFYRRRRDFVSAPRGSIGLRPDRNDFMIAGQTLLQAWHRGCGCSHEDYSHHCNQKWIQVTVPGNPVTCSPIPDVSRSVSRQALVPSALLLTVAPILVDESFACMNSRR